MVSGGAPQPRRQGVRIWLGLAAAVALSWGAPAPADAGEPAQMERRPVQRAEAAGARPFDIPAQPLGGALAAFGRQSGLQVSYASDLIAGARSAGISGSMLPEVALQALLAGTGIVYRFTDGGAVTLERVAAGAAPGALVLDPVMVKGERTERTLRDTAASVRVFDSIQLEERPHITSTTDVLTRTPNIVVSETSNFAPAVRGIDGTGPAQGADAFFAGVRPRLNIQIDGRPASYNEIIFGDFALWDVEQVEVFRGPQSTLQGRNSIAGTVVVKTKDPTWEPEAVGRVIVGNQNTRQYSAAASTPIIDEELAIRLSFDRKTFDSFVEFQPFGEVDSPGDFESLNLRGKLLFQPKGIEGFSTLVTLSHSSVTAPQGEQVALPYEDHVAAYPDMPTFHPKTTSGIFETTWLLNDNLTFENTISLTRLYVKRRAPLNEGNADISGNEYLFEPRLRFSAFDGRLTGLGGVHLFRASQDEFIDFGGQNNYEDSTETNAVFGEATYKLFEDFDVILGGRFESEHRERSGGVPPFFDVDLDATYNVFLPKFGVAWRATDELTVGATVARGYNGGGAGVSFAAPFVAYTYDPEYVWNYEAYARADLLGGRLQLSGNLFYSRYKDIQLPFQLGPLSTVIRNADRAVTYGAEMGATWLAAPGLEVFADIGLLKTEITSFPGSSIEGNDLARSPAVTADMGAIYRHSSGFDFGADLRVSDAYYSAYDNNPRGKVDPYWVANAQLGYNFENGARVFAFVDNIFDASDRTLKFPNEGDVADVLRPRTFGIGFQMTF